MTTTAAERLAANASLEEALVEARTHYTGANPKSLALHREAERALPGGNTRTVLYFGPFPLRFAGGNGCHLTDVDGHAYVDFLAEYTAGMFGHSHPVIRRAIERALADCAEQGITGKDITPYLLGRLVELSDGRSLQTNLALVRNNAVVGTAIAVAYAAGA